MLTNTEFSIRSAFSILYEYCYLIIPVSLACIAVKRRYLSLLSKHPGPFWASVTRLWKLYLTSRGRSHIDLPALHDKYGPIVRIAPNEVSLASPEAARQLLSAGKGFHKTSFYWVFPPPSNPDIFTEIREHVHAQKKRVANVPYSMAAMQQLAPFIEDTIDMFFEKLDGFTHANDTTVDLGAWLHYFAFDVLGEVAFSRKFGFLEQGVDVEKAIKTIDDSQWYNGLIGQIPELDYVFRRNPIWSLLPNTGPGLITRIALSEMDKRKPFENIEKSDRQDLLASLIKGHLKDPSKFSTGDVFAVAHGAIFAGSDSTASTMQSFFYHVLKNAPIYAKLQSEIETAARSGTISAKVQWSEAQQLPYFQACLKETFRMRPAVGLNITRAVPVGGAEIDGVKYAAGTEIAVNGWVLHRDKTIFGDDVDVFRPERWLDDKENAKNMERYLFHFGGGSHVCIGRNLALLEINKVLPHLLREYTFKLARPDAELTAHTTFFVVQEGLDVYITRNKA
ncbi:cytochrome P450 [Pseudovirgaria hyperparasitica]|uniref:Cytochrome P450 n=1 Tax=Pseudovirgaria hyperparasitica TaxID=470096 RepID=A0A6A6WCG4_9PEZI|nr:cytochrome P450 [Pseudovirgaria hyperparasitica]KAF2759869.1 cytochrome P450 [Pseudovirgaria hyperparasitica]